MTENKVYAVKRQNEFWAVIDCGETKTGGMATGNFWHTHFRKDGNTYRWFAPLFSPPENLTEWQEISVIQKMVTVVDANGHKFEGWEDKEDLAFTTLKAFSEKIGHPLSIDKIKELINS